MVKRFRKPDTVEAYNAAGFRERYAMENDNRTPIIGITYAMNGNLQFWHDFNISEEDENKIWEILSKYDTSGISVSGTKEDIVNEINSMYSED